MKRVLNHPWFLWLILATPSIPIMIGISSGDRLERLLHSSGEFAARFMIIAMMLSPLLLLCRTMKWETGWVLWLIRHPIPALVNFFPLACLELFRINHWYRQRKQKDSVAAG